MIRRLSLSLLGLLALAIGVLALDWISNGRDDPERSASRSAKGADAPKGDGFVTPSTCEGAGGECVWSVQLLADFGTGIDGFEDVSCPSSMLCIAVGNDRYANYYPRQGLLGTWTGRRWKTIRPFEGGTKAISCPTTRWCTVIGNTPPQIWSLERRKARPTWQVDPGSPPRPRGAKELTLSDVSCTSKTACTVAGIYWNRGYKNYVSRWDGSRWRFQPAPKPDLVEVGATHGMLGLSCASASFCATVGAFDFKPFIEQWDGAEWKIALALGDLPDAGLDGISCTSPTDCMAVGHLTEKSGATSPYSQRWNGSNWSVVDTPPLRDDGAGALRSISCLSASSCVAVGSISYPVADQDAEETLVMAWDGSKWTQRPSPNPRAFSSLAGVSCSPNGACTAVGTASTGLGGSGEAMTLVERFGQ